MGTGSDGERRGGFSSDALHAWSVFRNRSTAGRFSELLSAGGEKGRGEIPQRQPAARAAGRTRGRLSLAPDDWRVTRNLLVFRLSSQHSQTDQ